MSYQVWLAYMLACWVISISPGAGAIASMSSGLNYGFRPWILECFRFTAGTFSANRDCAAGVGVLICHHTLGFFGGEMVWRGVLVVFGIPAMDSTRTGH